MTLVTGQNRRFLFLQGPHGPFFHRLGKMLRLSGAEVWRVGFNAGDRAFWFDPKSYIPFRGTPNDWDETFQTLIQDKQITDIVLYGDTRPIHAKAVESAKNAGRVVQPFWPLWPFSLDVGFRVLGQTNPKFMQAASLRAVMLSSFL